MEPVITLPAVESLAGKELELIRLRRMIDPPLVMRDRCRFCGHPIVCGEDTVARKHAGKWPEVFAHAACHAREVKPCHE